MAKHDFSEIHFENCSATARELREQLWAKEKPKAKEKVEKAPMFGGLPWKMLAYIFLAAATATTGVVGASGMGDQITDLYAGVEKHLNEAFEN